MGELINAEDFLPQVEKVQKAFHMEWERFSCFASEPTNPLFVEGLESHWQGDSLLQKAESAFRDLKDLRVRMLGKKGEITSLQRMIGGTVVEAHRPYAGQTVKSLANFIVAALDAAEPKLQEFITTVKIAHETIDVTMPGRRARAGHLHPITLMRQRIEDIFVSLGYAVEDDREIETDFYNFDALNIPEGHPARDEQDTFYTTEGFALRSQTSTVQIHAMQRRGAPVRMIAPGRVFRRDTPDPTHNPMFFQVEGLCVDRGITMAHLKGTLQEFVHRLFGPETKTRFRPSYFPFTEPSAEVDYSCFNCGGSGCRICKWCGWIELGGSGMVHPNVLRGAGVDAEEFTGFAFGLGIDRTCARIYELDDIRLLFENDVRFLEQFR